MILLRSVVDKMITEVCGQKGAIKALNEGCLWDRTTKIKWTQGGKIIWNKQMQLFQKEFSIRTKKLQTSQVLNRKEVKIMVIFIYKGIRRLHCITKERKRNKQKNQKKYEKCEGHKMITKCSLEFKFAIL